MGKQPGGHHWEANRSWTSQLDVPFGGEKEEEKAFVLTGKGLFAWWQHPAHSIGQMHVPKSHPSCNVSDQGQSDLSLWQLISGTPRQVPAVK